MGNSHDTALVRTKMAMRQCYSLLTGLLVFLAFLIYPAYTLQDPDSLWHVVVGSDMIDQLSFTMTDKYSYTFFGQRWIAHEWLGEVILAMSYKLAGWNGVVLVAVLSVSTTAGLLVWYLTDIVRPTIVVALVFIIQFLVSPTCNARPYIFIFPLLVVWTSLLFRAAERNTNPPYIPLFLLLVLWVNTHGTFILGFIVAFAAFLEYLERNRFSDLPVLRNWILFGLACPVVMLLNPYGLSPFIEVITMAGKNEAVSLVDEWRPFNVRELWPHVLFLMSLLFGLLVSRFQVSKAVGGFITLTLFLFLAYIRFIFFFLLTFPIAAAPSFSKRYPAWSSDHWRLTEADAVEVFISRHLTAIRTGIVSMAAIATLLFVGFRDVEPVPINYAKPAILYAKGNGLTEGNVLNSYNLGGTLIFHGIKTFIDGRTDQLFGDGFAVAEHEMGKPAGKKLLIEALKRYDISWAILSIKDTRSNFFDEFEGWQNLYSDEFTRIYARKN